VAVDSDTVDERQDGRGRKRSFDPDCGARQQARRCSIAQASQRAGAIALSYGTEAQSQITSEIDFRGKTAIQVYDGTKGWKLRPYLNRHEVEPFTADELKVAAMQSDLDGPLVDYAAKGTKVALEGADKVDGNDAYRLKLTFKNGSVQHLWIDAKTFLEAKIEGTPRRLDGKSHSVEVYYHDFRPVSGLMIPFVSETKVQGVKQTEKILVEKAAVNSAVEDSRFAKLQ